MKLTDKYIIKTDSLKGFSMNDMIERLNDYQYGKSDSLPGERCIGINTIKRNPEWFRPVKNHADLFRETIEKWDAGESVWSIEMGGLGPGYEQAIQVLFIETLRNLLDKEPILDDTSSEDWETVKEARDKAIEKLNEDWGYSGAQAGAAANLAFHFWTKGMYKTLDDEEVSDRKIQVSNNLKFARA